MDDAKNLIQDAYREHVEHYRIQLASGNLTFANNYTDHMAKIVLLSAASYFETSITDIIKTNLNTVGCSLTASFIEKKALSRQYHTFFNWDLANANSFFSLFGDDFKSFMLAKIKQKNELDVAIKAFMLLGSLRNQLVHKNFITFSVPLTADEIMEKFESAHKNFVSKIPEFIQEFRELQAREILA